MTVKNHYNEIFGIEIDGWCYGVKNYPGELNSGIIHAVIKELGPTFRRAIEHHFIFDVLLVAKNISLAAKVIVEPKEVAFSILANFPHPQTLPEEEQYVLAQLVDQVEKEYGGALSRLKRKWASEAKKQAAVTTKANPTLQLAGRTGRTAA
jgi:hypothetical protein